MMSRRLRRYKGGLFGLTPTPTPMPSAVQPEPEQPGVLNSLGSSMSSLGSSVMGQPNETQPPTEKKGLLGLGFLGMGGRRSRRRRTSRRSSQRKSNRRRRR